MAAPKPSPLFSPIVLLSQSIVYPLLYSKASLLYSKPSLLYSKASLLYSKHPYYIQSIPIIFKSLLLYSKSSLLYLEMSKMHYFCAHGAFQKGQKTLPLYFKSLPLFSQFTHIVRVRVRVTGGRLGDEAMPKYGQNLKMLRLS